jgi:hypothetical protein
MTHILVPSSSDAAYDTLRFELHPNARRIASDAEALTVARELAT